MFNHAEQTSFLQEVDKKIKKSLEWDGEDSRSRQPELAAAAEHLCMAPGAKRARPRMVWMLGDALNAERDLLSDISMAGEFIHTASLLHDDVIDNGVIRRGRECVNVKWDSLTAVLAGDLLLAEAIKGLHNCPRVVAQEALEVVADMTRSTMLEAHIRADIEMTIDQWEYIAKGKTAAIFSWCGRAPAHLVNDMDALNRFGKFGHLFGLAFQMADDLLDLQNSNSGKTAFADILNKNPSYPIILAKDKSPGFKQELATAWKQEALNESQVKRLGMAVIATGAADQTRRKIEEITDAAVNSLGPFSDRPGCKEIATWADLLLKRIPRSHAV